MSVLPAVKLILARSPVAAMAAGGIHQFRIPQDAVMPNVMLMQVGGGVSMTHQGPSSLQGDLIRVYSRGATDQAAINLAKAVISALQAFRGTIGTVEVQMIRHTNTITDYTDDLKIFRQISDFRVHYGA